MCTGTATGIVTRKGTGTCVCVDSAKGTLTGKCTVGWSDLGD